MRRIKITNTETQRKHRRIGTVLLAWAIVLAAIALCIFVGVKVFLATGKSSLKHKANTTGPVLTVEESSDAESSAEPEVPEGVKWQDNWVSYNGEIYEYNENIMTFLILGIDKKDKVTKNPDKVSGGQSDAIFLVITNPDDKTIKLLGINRDTMTDIQMAGMGEAGEDKWTTAQLASQHGFGDGMEQSCEMTRDRVSELLYGLPIHGYVSINMGAIAPMTDAVGGVTLTCLEDMTFSVAGWTEGKEITLKGDKAYHYIHDRDLTKFESARGRLARQKQYLSIMGKTLVQKTKDDITFPVTLYNKFKNYMVTDFSVNEISWLASELVSYTFDGNQIYTLEGETRMGEKHEEFYPDKTAMKDLLVQLFYKKVDIEQ